MINWLKRLFHFHVWVDVEKSQLTDYNFRGEVAIVGDRYIQQCSVCKKMRKVDLR